MNAVKDINDDNDVIRKITMTRTLKMTMTLMMTRASLITIPTVTLRRMGLTTLTSLPIIVTRIRRPMIRLRT